MSCRQHITMSTFEDNITSLPHRFPTRSSLSPPPRADRKMASSPATAAMPTASPTTTTTTNASTSPSGPSYLHGYLSDEEAASPVEDNDQTNEDDDTDAASLFSIGTLEDVVFVEPTTTTTMPPPQRRCCQQAQAMKLYHTAGQVRMVSVPRPDDVPASPRTLRHAPFSPAAAPIEILAAHNGSVAMGRASNDSSNRSSQESARRDHPSDSEADSAVSTAPSSPHHYYNNPAAIARAAARDRDAHKSTLSDASTAVSSTLTSPHAPPPPQQPSPPADARPTPRSVPLFEAAMLANEPLSTAYALRSAQNPWSANWFATDPHFRQHRTAVVTKPFDPDVHSSSSSDDDATPDRAATTPAARRKPSLMASALGFARLGRGLGRRNSSAMAGGFHAHAPSASTTASSFSTSATHSRAISPATASPFLQTTHRRNISDSSSAGGGGHGPTRSASVRVPKMVARGADEREPPLILPPCPLGDSAAPALRRASTVRAPPQHRHTTYELDERHDLDRILDGEEDKALEAGEDLLEKRVLAAAAAPKPKPKPAMPLRRQKSSQFFWPPPVRQDAVAVLQQHGLQRPRSQSVQLLSGTML